MVLKTLPYICMQLMPNKFKVTSIILILWEITITLRYKAILFGLKYVCKTKKIYICKYIYISKTNIYYSAKQKYISLQNKNILLCKTKNIYLPKTKIISLSKKYLQNKKK